MLGFGCAEQHDPLVIRADDPSEGDGAIGEHDAASFNPGPGDATIRDAPPSHDGSLGFDAEIDDADVDEVDMPAPVEILVYNNNIENLPETGDPCPGDWRDLYSYMKKKKHVPDLLVFQQVSNQAQLDFILKQLQKTTGKEYAGVIGEASPTPFVSPCREPKRLQTNAIIFRRDRFARTGTKRNYRSFRNQDGSCVRANNSRNRTLLQGLRHRGTGKVVGVAAIRWPTAQGGGPDPACAVANARETDGELRKHVPDAALYVIAGDANESDLNSTNNFRRWFELINGDRAGALGYRDAVYARCANEAGLKACLNDNWTGGAGRRIDFTFYKLKGAKLPRVRGAHTVSYDEADAADRDLTGGDHPANYSQHRAIHSLVTF